MKRTSQLVRLELSRNSKSRDSDKVLYTNILQELGADLTDKQIDIIMSISSESVRRLRQRWQEQGKYLGSPEVMAERQHKSLEVQQSIKSTSVDKVAELLERPVEIVKAKRNYIKVFIDDEWVVREVLNK